MKKTDDAVRLLMPFIENKDILEVACGAAGFSLSALPFAKSVSCIDLDDSRLDPQAASSGVHFQIMDAAKMDYPDHVFDTIVIYNAFYHIRSQWKEIEAECRRVSKRGGSVFIIGSWKLDTGLMKDTFADKAELQGGFMIVRIAVE